LDRCRSRTTLRPGKLTATVAADDLARLIQSQLSAFAQAIKDAKVPLES
jgi:hypothetical protein